MKIVYLELQTDELPANPGACQTIAREKEKEPTPQSPPWSDPDKSIWADTSWNPMGNWVLGRD